MEKIFYSLVIAATILLFSCEKVEDDMKDYYPVINTLSATVLQDGSVQLTGQIVSEGNKPVDGAGFCVSTNPVPKMLDAQAIASISGSTFTANYSGFPIQTKFYFRSWAINENGYTYGNIISLDSISATPLVAPCSPSMNIVNIGSGTETIYSVDAPSSSSSGWSFQAQSNSVSMTINMGEKPVTKIYTTTTSSSPSPDQINIYFYSGFISGTLSSGSPVYVNQTGVNEWEITICSALWTGNNNGYMTARFKTPL